MDEVQQNVYDWQNKTIKEEVVEDFKVDEIEIKEEPIDWESAIPELRTVNIKSEIHIKEERANFEISNEETYECGICWSSFTAESPLKAHIQSHEEFKRYYIKQESKGTMDEEQQNVDVGQNISIKKEEDEDYEVDEIEIKEEPPWDDQGYVLVLADGDYLIVPKNEFPTLVDEGSTAKIEGFGYVVAVKFGTIDSLEEITRTLLSIKAIASSVGSSCRRPSEGIPGEPQPGPSWLNLPITTPLGVSTTLDRQSLASSPTNLSPRVSPSLDRPSQTSSQIETIMTRKRRKLTLNKGDGHLYIVNSNRLARRIYYRCSKYTETGCNGRMICEGDNVVSSTHHNHSQPTESEINRLRIQGMQMQRLLQRSTTVSIPIGDIINQEMRNEDPTTSIELNRAARSMARARRLSHPPVPDTLAEWGALLSESPRNFVWDETEPIYRKSITIHGRTSLLFFSSRTVQRLQSFRNINYICIDTTFSVRPRTPRSAQLLTVLVVVESVAFPCIYALMEARTKHDYVSILTTLKNVLDLQWPRIIFIADFEKGLIESIQSVFPESSQEGCLFHFTQSIRRRLIQLGLEAQVRNEQVADVVRMIMAVPFLPQESVVEGFEAIRQHVHNQGIQNLEPLLRYVYNFWIARVENFSIYRSEHRANNLAESYHFFLSRRGRHLPAWQFFELLLDLEARTVRELSQIARGKEIRNPRRSSRLARDERLRQVQSEPINDIIMYLRTCGHHSENIVNFEDDKSGSSEEDDYLQPLPPLQVAPPRISPPPLGHLSPPPPAHLSPRLFPLDSDDSDDSDDPPAIGRGRKRRRGSGSCRGRGSGSRRGTGRARGRGRRKGTGTGRDRGRLCVICLEETPSWVVVPCYHLCFCITCKNLQEVIDMDRCPVCRGDRQQVIQIF